MSVRQIGNKDIYLKFDDSYIEGLFAVQGETGRSYTFTLVDEAGRRINASGYTLSMNIFIDEGVSQSSARGSSDGRFTIPIRQDMLTRYGKADVQLILSDGTDTLGSLVGSMRIERNLNYDNGKGANLLIDFKEIKQNLAALNSIKGEVNDSINKAVDCRDKSCECATRACECASLAQDGAKKAEKIRDEADDIIKSEADRKAEETKRKSAERARASQESTRQGAESARAKAETQRKSQESTRQAEEEKRRSAEDARLKEESNRKSEESARKENETKRLAQESQRAEAEKDRVSAEDLRQKAEGERKATFEAWDKTMSGDLPPASTISPGVVKLDKVGEDTAISKGTFDGFKADLDAKVDKVKDKGLSTNDYTNEAKSKVDAIPDSPKYTDTVYDDADIKSELEGKVDKVSGKELSSNDFTDDYKSKLDALPANPEYTDTTYDLSSYAKKTDLKSGLDGKVDKVAGKALSSNDYTDEAKAKVDAIPDDPKYTDTAYDDTEIKEEIVSTKRELGEFIESATENYAKTSDLTPYVKTADLESYAKRTEIKTKLSELTEDSTHRTVTDTEKTTWNNKVDKESGKALSSNDFTNMYKSKLDSLTSSNSNGEATTSNRGYMSASDKKKLDGIESGANKYTHPKTHPISMITGLQEELDKSTGKSASNGVFVIASHDSSENSKKGADFVVGTNDNFADIVNSCIKDLPSCGGKIVLTEGTFTYSGNKSIELNRTGVVIEGHGKNTTHIKKVNSSDAMFRANADNCEISSCSFSCDDKMFLYAYSNSITIRNCEIKSEGNCIITAKATRNISIRDCDMTSAGDFPALVLEGKYHTVFGCRITQNEAAPIWLKNACYDARIIGCDTYSESGSNNFGGDGHVIIGNGFRRKARISAAGSIIANNREGSGLLTPGVIN